MGEDLCPTLSTAGELSRLGLFRWTRVNTRRLPGCDAFRKPVHMYLTEGSPLGCDSPFDAPKNIQTQNNIYRKKAKTRRGSFLRDSLCWLASAEANVSGSTVMPSRQTDRSPTTSEESLSALSWKVCTTSETTVRHNTAVSTAPLERHL